MTPKIAKEILGAQYLGPLELRTLPFTVAEAAPAVPYSRELLRARRDSHILVFTPETYADGAPITLNSLREKFGVDPHVSEPCMYNQDWYLKEDFAARRTLDGKWHLIQKKVRDDARAKPPEDIEKILKSEGFSTAVTYAFAFFAWWFARGGERLWEHDFVWCSDRDHNNDRVYVGCYEDPSSINKNGFNIHRHLSLRPAYSAAPEITG